MVVQLHMIKKPYGQNIKHLMVELIFIIQYPKNPDGKNLMN